MNYKSYINKEALKCMENNKAIVIGALGQDGSFMCDILVSNGYDVYGVVKPETNRNRFREHIKYIHANVSNSHEIIKLLTDIKPIHIYNLMGVTDVFDPWSNAEIIYENNLLVPIKIIDAIKNVDKSIRYLQASTSLVFGQTTESPQNESTHRNPIYHYGIAKNFTDSIIKTYREKYGMFLCSAILYSHESERRGENFLTKKIIRQAIEIKNGLRKLIEVGDINGHRDIGYAKDYMNACHMMMINITPDDYVVGTGTSTQTIEFIKVVFEKIGLSIEKNLIINEGLKRNIDLSHLIANNIKIKGLGWEPKTDLNEIIDIMIKSEIEKNAND